MDNILRQQFVDGMARVAASVAVVTSDGPAGRCGITVSSFTAVSADGAAPSVLVCVNKLASAAPVILANASFCANVLTEDQAALSDLFSGRSGVSGEDRFDKVPWHTGPAGNPILEGAAVSFDSRLSGSFPWETHHLLIGHVVAVEHHDGEAGTLLYSGRRYRRAVGLGD